MTDDNLSKNEQSNSHAGASDVAQDSASSPGESAVDDLPTVIGGVYEIIGILGHGGMGSVVKARNLRLQSKLYAIKVLNPVLMLTDPAVRQRFEIEAQSCAKLSHPNLVTVFDYGFTELNAPYLVMEFLDGASLDHILKSDTKLGCDELVPVFVQVAKALQYIHSQNVVHRDLKPHNIMVQVIGNERYAKLIDLGIAKVFTEDGHTAQHLTATGMAFGSPYYMSPEQCKGGKIDPRSDLYSFGCVMYECLAEHPPFQGENSLQTLFKQVTETPPPLECKTGFERELAIIIEQCMQKEPEHRFQSASDLLTALNKVANNERNLGASVEPGVGAEPRDQARPRPKIQLESQISPHAKDVAQGEVQPQLNGTTTQSSRRPPPQPQAAPPPADVPVDPNMMRMTVAAAVVVGLLILGWLSYQSFNQLAHAPHSMPPEATTNSSTTGRSTPNAVPIIPASAIQPSAAQLQPSTSQTTNNPTLPSTSNVTAPVPQATQQELNELQQRLNAAQQEAANLKAQQQQPSMDVAAQVQRLKEQTDRLYTLRSEQMRQVQMNTGVNRYWNNVNNGLEGLNQELERRNAQFRTNGR